MEQLFDAIHIESIEISRAPGLRGGIKLDGFVPGINVIAGPNASGKSTTARLLHELFWKTAPAADHAIDATVRFSVQDQQWLVRRNGPVTSWYCEGEPVSRPQFDFMSDDLRGRYLLAFHDLVKTKDEGFASEILREAAGGYDLGRAEKSVKYQLSPADSSLHGAWERARKQHAAALSVHRTLVANASELEHLEETENAAAKARLELAKLERIEAALLALSQRETAASALGELPDTLANIPKNALERIEEIRALEQSSADRDRLNRADTDAALMMVESTGIVIDDGIVEDLERLRLQLQALERFEGELRGRRMDLASRDQRIRSRGNDISVLLDPEQAGVTSASLLEELSRAVVRQEGIANQRVATLKVQDLVGELHQPDDLTEVQEAIRLLKGWLSAPDQVGVPDNERKLRWLIGVASLVIIVEAALLGNLVTNAFYGLTIIALIMLGVLLAMRRVPEIDRRLAIQNEYENLALELPSTWSASIVGECLDSLVHFEHSQKIDAARFAVWRNLPAEVSAAEAAFIAISEEASALREKLGLVAIIDRHSLEQVATSIRVWTESIGDAAGLRGEIALCESEFSQSLERLNELASRFGADPSPDLISADSVLKSVRDRVDLAQNGMNELKSAERTRRDSIAPALERAAVERQRLLSDTGAPDFETIEKITPEAEQWRQLTSALEQSELVLAERVRDIPDIDLGSWSLDRTIDARSHNKVADRAGQDASQRIGGIRERVRLASEGRDVEEALNSLTTSEAALRERFVQRVQAITSDVIIAYVRRQTERSALSIVAEIARKHFSSFTNGRYELQFRTSPEPMFVAADRLDDGILRTLDELSSGTRVQLLLAVRVAFVEANEPRVRLPLYFDETLANSDDIRAEAMIAATTRLSAGGRQVFYFTAQEDEVERWQMWHQVQPEFPFQVFSLNEEVVRIRPIDRVVLTTLIRDVPHPNGCTRDDYRQKLAVPSVDLWMHSGDDIHLWYVIPDPEVLYTLLRQHVTTWGQLRSFAESGSAGVFGVSAGEVLAIQARANACQAIRHARRIGHGVPVNASIVQETGAITNTYREGIYELLQAVAGDGAEFLRRLNLRQGKLKGFYSSNVDLIEEHFRANGHITEVPQLSTEEIKHRVLIALREELQQQLITLEGLDQLFDDLSSTESI